MALCAPTKASPSGTMGNPIFGHDAEQDAFPCSRLLFLNYRKLGDAHIFHGSFAYTLLVWIHKPR